MRRRANKNCRNSHGAQTKVGKLLRVRTRLIHLTFVTYALPRSRLAPHVPLDHLEIPEFAIGGAPRALLSAVSFYNHDFRFVRLAPSIRLRFGQTNYRAYVIDRSTGEHAVWFLGATLSSRLVYFPRLLWKVPWHYGQYTVNCQFDRSRGVFEKYKVSIVSQWASARIEIEDTGQPLALAEGFSSTEEMKRILTHPTTGFFRRLDGMLGSYSVQHEPMPCTRGIARRLYFNLLERLGLLSPEEMAFPHSVLLCPEIDFEVDLPPRREVLSEQASCRTPNPDL